MGRKFFRLNLALAVLQILTTQTVWAKTGSVTAFVHVNLVPMTSETVLPDQTVLVGGSRITAVGPSERIHIPDGSTIIDGSNGFLLPGLADMHMHTDTGWLTGDWPVSPLHLYLANGVTAIRCFGTKGGTQNHVLYWREGIRRGDIIGPALYTCGEQLRGRLENPEALVHKKKAEGYDFIKFYSYVTQDEFHRAMSTAGEIGIYTAGHIPFQVGLDGILSEGMNEIAHVEELFWEFVDFDRNRYFRNEHEWMAYVTGRAFRQYEPYLNAGMRDMEKILAKSMSMAVKKLQSRNIPVCTTLFLDNLIVEKLFQPDVFLSRPENKYLPKSYRDAFRKGREKHQRQFRGGEAFALFKRKADLMLLHHLKGSGVPLVLATDAGTGGMGLVPGFSIHQELRVLTQNGFTPYEALKTATVNAAGVVSNMIGAGDFGTIEAGKRADLVLLDGNPLHGIACLSTPKGVMASGRWYSRAELQRMVTPGIPVIGAIHHVREADKKRNTYAEVVIGARFSGRLPEAIASIDIIGPKGKLPLGKNDFTYLPGLRDFWIKMPGVPQKGIYRFVVTGEGGSGSTFDYQYDVRKIPVPDRAGLSPANGAELETTTPTFSWAAVEAKHPLYYRLEIERPGEGRVYSTRRCKKMVSHTVPGGILRKGRTYRWRLRLMDSDNWVNVQNRSQTSWRVFHIR